MSERITGDVLETYRYPAIGRDDGLPQSVYNSHDVAPGVYKLVKVHEDERFEKGWLYDQYWRQFKSIADIAETTLFSSDQLLYQIRKSSIPLRQSGVIHTDWRIQRILDGSRIPEALAQTCDDLNESQRTPPDVSKERLYELYWTPPFMSIAAVADEVDSSKPTVTRAMKEYGVPRRQMGGTDRDDWRLDCIARHEDDDTDDSTAEYDIHNALAWLFTGDGSDPIRPYGSRYPWVSGRAYYYDHYWGEGMSAPEVAALPSFPYGSDEVLEKMQALGIPRRQPTTESATPPHWEPSEIPPRYDRRDVAETAPTDVWERDVAQLPSD